MALHVTNIAAPSLAVAETSSRRTALAGSIAGQTATETAPLASQIAASFGSLLATNSAAARSAAAVSAQTVKRSPIASASSTASAGTTAAATGTSADTSTAVASASGLSDFELLFGGSSYNPADPVVPKTTPAASSTAAATPPTPQSVFGANVWMTDPTGLNPDGSSFEYNPIYFATASTAQTVAKMIGGTVVADDEFTEPAGNVFVQQQPNYMVKMPNGAMINPGLVASFYSFGFSQSQIDTMIAQEVANTPPRAQTT